MELAIRASIGAGRGRSDPAAAHRKCAAGPGGSGDGRAGRLCVLDSLVALIPLSLPANSPVAINATVLAFALGLTIITALLFGLVPALKLSRAPNMISTMLSVGGRGGAPLSRRAGQWLIAVEVTLALVLMSCSGLILRSFVKLVSVDLGFDSANVLTLEVEPLDQSAALRRQYYPLLADALRRLPEVASAGAIDQLSLPGGGSYGFPQADNGGHVEGPQRTVLPGCLEAMGVRPLAGRLFDETDRATGDVVVVNAASSQRYFDGNAIGHTFQFDTANVNGASSAWCRTSGMVVQTAATGPSVRTAGSCRGRKTAPMTLAMVMRLRGRRPCPRIG